MFRLLRSVPALKLHALTPRGATPLKSCRSRHHWKHCSSSLSTLSADVDAFDKDNNFRRNNREFYNISQDEMDRYLHPQGFRTTDNESTGEIVYEKLLPVKSAKKQGYDPSRGNLVLRVFSGIHRFTGESRACGKDAIRVVLLFVSPREEHPLKKSSRVNRLPKWRDNLQKRIDERSNYKVQRCGCCNSVMVERTGKFGPFMGCYRFPDCKYTVGIGNFKATNSSGSRTIEL